MYSEQNMILYTVLCTLQYTAILSFSQKVTSEVCECGVSSGVRCEGGSDVSWWGEKKNIYFITACYWVPTNTLGLLCGYNWGN